MKNHNISFVSLTGVLAILIFLIFTFTAVSMFSGDYNPLNNYLSDLGNSSYNSNGAIFFNLGCIITGLLLILFFYGFKIWYKTGKHGKNLLITSQLVGIYASFSLIMVGVFSEDYGPLHWIWSASFFLSLMFTLILSNIYLLNHSQFIKKIAYYGFFVVFIDIMFIIIYILKMNISASLFEWITVLLSLVWAGMIAYNINIIYLNNEQH